MNEQYYNKAKEILLSQNKDNKLKLTTLQQNTLNLGKIGLQALKDSINEQKINYEEISVLGKLNHNSSRFKVLESAFEQCKEDLKQYENRHLNSTQELPVVDPSTLDDITAGYSDLDSRGEDDFLNFLANTMFKQKNNENKDEVSSQNHSLSNQS